MNTREEAKELLKQLLFFSTEIPNNGKYLSLPCPRTRGPNCENCINEGKPRGTTCPVNTAIKNAIKEKPSAYKTQLNEERQIESDLIKEILAENPNILFCLKG